MLKKINVDSKVINFFIVSGETGKIKSSGDIDEDTWEDTYVNLASIQVGKAPSICFNKAHRTRHIGKEPVWTDLNYVVTSVEEIKDAKFI